MKKTTNSGRMYTDPEILYLFGLESADTSPAYNFKSSDNNSGDGLFPLLMTAEEFTILEEHKIRFLKENQDLNTSHCDYFYNNTCEEPLVTFATEILKEYPILLYKVYHYNIEDHFQMFAFFSYLYMYERIRFYKFEQNLNPYIAREHAHQDLKDYYESLNCYSNISPLDENLPYLKRLVAENYQDFTKKWEEEEIRTFGESYLTDDYVDLYYSDI